MKFRSVSSILFPLVLLGNIGSDWKFAAGAAALQAAGNDYDASGSYDDPSTTSSTLPLVDEKLLPEEAEDDILTTTTTTTVHNKHSLRRPSGDKSIPTGNNSSSSSVSAVVQSKKKAKDDLARIVDEVDQRSKQQEEDVPGSEVEAVEELYQDLQTFQATLLLDTVAIAKASIEEKIEAMRDSKDTFVILNELVNHLKKTTSANGVHLSPVLLNIEHQVHEIDILTQDFIEIVNNQTTATAAAATEQEEDDHITASNFGSTLKNAAADQYDAQKKKRNDDDMEYHFNRFLEDEEEDEKRMNKMRTAGSPNPSTSKSARNDHHYHHNDDDNDHDKRNGKHPNANQDRQDQDRQDRQNQHQQQHWHGFKTHSEYRAWKRDHTRAHPRINHVFDNMEHIHTGRFDELRSKTIRRNQWHLDRYSTGSGGRGSSSSSGRRKLSPLKKVEEQCDILVKCATEMSMYDFVFYHFSDYIDTTTGVFASNFRVPEGFDLFQAEATIAKTIREVKKAREGTDKEKKCSHLLSLFHWNRPTADEKYFSWEGGIVSEVCYASGTTKLIDLYLIRENLGTLVAAKIFQETQKAAKTLFDSPFVSKIKSEHFLYKDGKYPVAVNGPEVDPSTKRPSRVINTNKFYRFANSYVPDFDPNALAQSDRVCPGNKRNGGIGPYGSIQCDPPKASKLVRPLGLKFLVVVHGRVSSAYASVEEANINMRRFYFLRLLHAPLLFSGSSSKKPLHMIVEVDGTKVEKADKGFHNLGEDLKKQADLEEKFLKAAKKFVDKANSGKYDTIYAVVERWYKQSWVDGLHFDKASALKDAKEETKLGGKDANKVEISPMLPSFISSYIKRSAEASKKKANYKRQQNTVVIALSNVNLDSEKDMDAYNKEEGLMGNVKLARNKTLSTLPLCAAPATIKNRGYDKDKYAGWYDVFGCGQCNYYCRWLGKAGGAPSFLNPKEKLEDGGLYWSCASVRGDDDRTFPRPFTFQRCHGIDSLLNSTKIVFGDATPGQVAALAQANSQVKDMKTWCPKGWTRKGFNKAHGYVCEKPDTVSSKDAQLYCAKLSGRWNTVDKCYFGKKCPPSWNSRVLKSGAIECYKEGVLSSILARACHAEDLKVGKFTKLATRKLNQEISRRELFFSFKREESEKTVAKEAAKKAADKKAAKKKVQEDKKAVLEAAKKKKAEEGAARNKLEALFAKKQQQQAHTAMGTQVCQVPTKHVVVRASIPGFCCLDDADVSGVWGEPYHCSQKCTNVAPALAGLSTSTCDLFGGTWCQGPTDCTKLKECVEEYLHDAEDEDSDSYNQVFAEYLSEAPNVTDVTDPFQCGQAREYFGFEPTFGIDGKICRDILEYRNSKDLNFMNEVFKGLPPVEPGDSKFPGLGYRAGYTPDDPDRVVSFEIETVDRAMLEETKPPKGGCNAAVVGIFGATLFALTTIYNTVESGYQSLVGFECPEDAWGIIKTLCAIGKNLATVVMAIAKILAKTILEIAQNVVSVICAAIDPRSTEFSFGKVGSLYRNSETIYNVIAEREKQTHEGLNSISAQLPKLDKKLEAIESMLSESKDRRLVVPDSNDDGPTASSSSAAPPEAGSGGDHIQRNMNSLIEEQTKMKELIDEMKAQQSAQSSLQQAALKAEMTQFSAQQAELKAEVNAMKGMLMELIATLQTTSLTAQQNEKEGI